MLRWSDSVAKDWSCFRNLALLTKFCTTIIKQNVCNCRISEARTWWPTRQIRSTAWLSSTGGELRWSWMWLHEERRQREDFFPQWSSGGAWIHAAAWEIWFWDCRWDQVGVHPAPTPNHHQGLMPCLPTPRTLPFPQHPHRYTVGHFAHKSNKQNTLWRISMWVIKRHLTHEPWSHHKRIPTLVINKPSKTNGLIKLLMVLPVDKIVAQPLC